MEMPFFQHAPARFVNPSRMARVCWRVRLLALLALGLLAWAALAPPLGAQSRSVPKEVQPLLSSSRETWLEGLAALRAMPNARQLLAQAVQVPSDRRWRAIHALGLMGTEEDVPVLAGLLSETMEPQERSVLLAALRALQPPLPGDADLSSLIRDPVFVPSSAPSNLRSGQDDQYVVTEHYLQTLHLERIPVRIVERLQGLRGRGYDSRNAFAEAIQSRLTPKQWQDFGEKLTAPALPSPPLAAAEGAVRYRVENPLPVALLITIDLGATSGKLEDPVRTRTLYLNPGQGVQVDQPVRVRGPREPGRVRLDLQPRTIHGLRIPEVFKVYVPLQG